MDFIHTYLHDSKVGFINNIEPFSYFSQRGVSESSRSVYGGLEYNINRPVNKAVESTVDLRFGKSAASQGIGYPSGRKGADQSPPNRRLCGGKRFNKPAGRFQLGQQGSRCCAKVGKAASEATQTALDRLDQAWKELSH